VTKSTDPGGAGREVSEHEGVETVGGFRLVRKLGEGLRAEVWLGHAGRSDDRTAAIKVYRPDTRIESIDCEIDALTRVSSPHLLQLDDVATAPDGLPCLILPRIVGPSLAKLMVERQGLDDGEFVTAIAPILGAVSALHHAGIAHGALGPPAVLLDERGAPILARFGAAAVVQMSPPPAVAGVFPFTHSVPGASAPNLTAVERAADPHLAADVERTALLVGALLGRLRPSAAVTALGEWLDRAGHDETFVDRLTERIYDLADPAPIELRSFGSRGITVGDPRAVGRAGANAVTPVSEREEVNGRVTAGGIQSLRRLFARWLDSSVGRSLDTSPTASVRGALRRSISSVRRPVWIAGVAGLVAVIAAIAIVSAAGSSPSDSRLPAGGAPYASGRPTTRATAGAAGSRAPALRRAMGQDDPVVAARALLTARTACIAARSTGCLAQIEQADSAAFDADRDFLRERQSGATVVDRRFDPIAAALVERLGDSAIIALGPATSSGAAQSAAVQSADAQSAAVQSAAVQSVLVVKVDGSWLLRDLTQSAGP
jgi:hypothetical protein